MPARKTNARPNGSLKSHANSDSSVPVHSPTSGASQYTSTAPRAIFPQRHSVDSGRVQPRHLPYQSFETSSSSYPLSLDDEQSLSPALSSYQIDTLESTHFNPATPISETALQEPSDLDEFSQEYGPLIPVDNDMTLRHRPTYPDKDKQTRLPPSTRQPEPAPMSQHTHERAVPRPTHASQLRYNSHNSRLIHEPTSQSLGTPHPLQNQLGIVDSDMSGTSSMSKSTDYLGPGLQPPRDMSEGQTDSGSNISDDDRTTIHPTRRRRLSSVAGTQANQMSAPSPNEQAEEREMVEKKAVVDDWMKCVSPDQVIDNEENNLDSGDISPTQEKPVGTPGSGAPPESSDSAMRDYGQLARDFDKISLAPTWGSARRHSFDSLAPSEISVNAAGITIVQPPRPRQKSLLQRIRSHGSGPHIPKPKPDPIPKVVGSPSDPIKDEHSPRSFSEDYTLRGSPPLSSSEQHAFGTTRLRGGFGSFLKRSRSRGHNDQQGLTSLLQQTGGPWAPMINLPETLSNSQPPKSQLPHPSSTEKVVEIDAEGSASPSGSDATHGTLLVPTSPTKEAFEQHACLTCPKMDKHLLEKVVNQQIRNYHRLVMLRHGPKARPHEGNPLQDNSETGAAARRPSVNPPKATSQWRIVRDGVANDRAETSLRDFDKPALLLAVFPRGVPLPPVNKLPAVFECPWCFKTLTNIKKPSDWTKHILEDIQPYICTFKDCTSSSLFKRKADWLRHESEKHRRTELWRCSVCTRICYRKDNFAQHLAREHPTQDPLHNNSKQDLRVETCHETDAKLARDEPCRFCGRRYDDWKPLTKHLAEHMEQISLPTFVLVEQSKGQLDIPIVTDEQIAPDDADQDSDDDSSVEAKKEEDTFDGFPNQAPDHGMGFKQMQDQTLDNFAALNAQSNNVGNPQPSTNMGDYPSAIMDFDDDFGGEDFSQFVHPDYLNLGQTESAPATFGANTGATDPNQVPSQTYGETLSLSTSPENVGKPSYAEPSVYNTFPSSVNPYVNNPTMLNNSQQSTYNNFHNISQGPINIPPPMSSYRPQVQQSEQLYRQPFYMLHGLAINMGQQPMSANAGGPQMNTQIMQGAPSSFSYPPPNAHIQQTNQYSRQPTPNQYPNQHQNPYHDPYMRQ